MSKDIYVRNLSPQTTEEDLRTLFAVAGKVTYVHLVTDQKTEQFLCCAYVKMSSEAEARDAISALNDARYMDAYISVTEALPRTPAGSPRPPQQQKAVRPPVSPGVQKKQARSIAKGDWTGPAPAKKKDRPAGPPRRKAGEEGRKSASDWTAAAAGGKKPREKRENSLAQDDWTAPAPAKKARPAAPSRSKTGVQGRKSASDWTPPTGSAPPARRKSSGPPRGAAAKKGPGPKRGQ